MRSKQQLNNPGAEHTRTQEQLGGALAGGLARCDQQGGSGLGARQNGRGYREARKRSQASQRATAAAQEAWAASMAAVHRRMQRRWQEVKRTGMLTEASEEELEATGTKD